MIIEHLEKALERWKACQGNNAYHKPLTYNDLRHIILEVKECEREAATKEQENHEAALEAAYGPHGQG